ncbi:Fic family protein [Bifidobacterium sp. ESL0745]|uniref:Fic family protein n=1 Tax=Bifidobacterium sp. ESL0745 TaxID=2983226 RepID=UPI0023F89C89|nr:Fic family protein [Bifidobacterium sp. ESL0745]MDF7664781.1 Fic family protein [Bifidobacterium sp. ESL0745]
MPSPMPYDEGMVMTPAERASAVAFSYKNCELSTITPSDAMIAAANGYQRGTIGLSDFVETPEKQAQRLRKEKSKSQNEPSRQGSGSHDAANISSIEFAEIDGGNGNHKQNQTETSEETKLRDDRIFARSVRLIDCGWPAYGGLDELKIIHRGLFVGAMNGTGTLRSESGTTTNRAIRVETKPSNQTNRSDFRQNNQYPSPYFPSALIETGAANIFSQLEEQDYFSHLDRSGFIRALASTYDELNALHPFAYGNGMVLRMFISELTHAVGWDLNWGSVTFKSYRDATNLALLNHDISGLERMFASIIRLANPTRIFLISGWDQGPAH